MTIHRIMAPDRSAGRELRAIVWNDETGEVTGDHENASWIAARLAGPMPVSTVGDYRPNFILADPAHAPADFLALILDIAEVGVSSSGPPLWGVHLPESLRGVEPTPPLPDDTPPGAVN